MAFKHRKYEIEACFGDFRLCPNLLETTVIHPKEIRQRFVGFDPFLLNTPAVVGYRMYT
jgi:hypothetical protein